MLLMASCGISKKVAVSESKTDVMAIINKVNTYWQQNTPPTQRPFWDVATYHTGNMEVYKLTKNENYCKYSEAWAEKNEWKGAKGADKTKWKYRYGETAFFTYAYLWGMNNGYFKKSDYEKVAMKGWNYLSKTALQPDGEIGYVQPIGEKAIQGQIVDTNSTANFGVGAFLLAPCEMYRFLDKN